MGIIAAAFLIMNAFTGFCWNFLDLTKPRVHTLTLTPTLPNPRSQPTISKSTLELAKILQIADAALPGAVTTYISLPQQPEEVFRIRQKFSQEAWMYSYSFVYLDQYTGEVLQLKNGLKPSLADKFFNSLAPIHFGTFGGLLTRIFYVFVGLTPTILFVTGWVIYRARS